jgi:hypothetical protein
MSKKTRYLIILAGFIVFFLLAPAIVFYISGVAYDFGAKKFIKTGTLNANSDPKKVNIYVDGQLERKTSGNIKFLISKEYNIEIKKDGYFEWFKRLKVEPGKVTWAAQVQKIFLLINPPVQTKIDEGVTDFASLNKILLYIKNGELAVGSTSNPLQNTKIKIPKPVNKIQISPNAKFAVLTSNQEPTSSPSILLFDLETAAFKDLSGLFSYIPEVKFAGNDIYALSEKNLYKINASGLKTAVLKNISAFALSDNNLYFIQNSEGINNLYVSELPSLEKTLLAQNLPAFNNAQIIINSKKEGFVVLDKTLYQIGSRLETIANSVDEWNMGLDNSSLIYSSSGELGYFSGNNENLITRTSNQLRNLALDTASNYAFYLKGGNLEAVELDTRDHQNEYVLYQSQQLQKFGLDNTAKNIFVLDGEDLKVLQIR